MKKSRKLLSISFFVLLFYSFLPQTCFAKVQNKTSAGFTVPTICKPAEESDHHLLIAKVKALFQADKFDELEKMAQKLRSSKEHGPSGVWILTRYYDCLAADYDGQDSSFNWAELFAKLKLWTVQKPASVTPRIAYAKALRNYAWKARGNGWADTVSPASWKEFEKRLNMAHKVITEAWATRSNDPELAATLLGIYLGEEENKLAYNKLFNQAIAAEPTFYSYYFLKAKYLQPRWHGTEGEWQGFTKEAADKLGGESGDILYARTVWNLYNVLNTNMFKQPYVDKDRVVRGFKALEKEYPDSVWVLSVECFADFEVGATAAAFNSMQKLKNRVDLGIWKNLDCFKQAKDKLEQLKKSNQLL